MDAFDCDYQTNRPEKEFPLARTEYKKLYIDAKNVSLCEEEISEESSCSYDSEDGLLNFDFTFEEEKQN